MPISPSPKAQGELAELRFLLKAVSLGLAVSKPYGDNLRYDFVVEAGGVLRRIQVKSSRVRERRCYHICTARSSKSKLAYTPADVDLLAIYLIPLNLWYLLPVSAVASLRTIRLCPARPGHRFEPYREAWHLLSSPEPSDHQITQSPDPPMTR